MKSRSSRPHARINRSSGHRSGLEGAVEKALREQGFSTSYETEKFDYVLHKKYTPDFKVGNVYIEVKGWWPSSERTKFLAVVMHNPTLRIFVALQKPHTTLSKLSKTTYAMWCQKYGIAWCPTPIPTEFINQWLSGARVTYHVPTQRDAVAQMRLPSVTMDQFGVIPAVNDSTRMENHGKIQ
jgi:hypothetical protein